MPVDSLSALRVASNVSQLVDFTARLISTGAVPYGNTTLVDHGELKAVAIQIRNLKFSVENSSEVVDEPTGGDEPETAVTLSNLREAYSSCIECANAVLRAIEKLTVSKENHKWTNFRHALSSVFRKDNLDATSQQLANARHQLINFLLLHASSAQAWAKQQLQQLLRVPDQADRHILDAIRNATSRLKHEASDLRRALLADAQSRDTSLMSFWESHATTDIAPIAEQMISVLAALARREFLSTLRFAEVYDRYDAVPEAHALTYRWALQHGARRDEQWDDLATWFESPCLASNLYWVTGQPGCGKSTLMKFLALSPTTKQLLAQWSRGRPILIAQCYFWAPGTDIQKCLEGMLRSLLLQLLDGPAAETVPLETICPARWETSLERQTTSLERQKTSPPWLLTELKNVFRLVVEHLTKESFVMLFVDGLDEYGKDHTQRQELINLFMSMRNISSLKMCLSSRPWNIFSDAFGELPSLVLERLNRPDIESYVVAECTKSKAFKDLSAIDPGRATAIRNKVVDKSSGVFLWVTLVTRRLLNDMQDGTGLIRAEQVLDEMPPGLDEYFRFMLESIRPSDRRHAARIYQTMVWHKSQDRRPTLRLLSFVGEDEPSFAHSQNLEHESLTTMKTRVSGMRRYFASQSMDLLVYTMSHNPEITLGEDPDVDYLHRTVADFLRTRGPQELLRSYAGENFDARWYCVNAFVSQILCLERAESGPSTRDQLFAAHTWRAKAVNYFSDLVTILKGVSSEHDADVEIFFAKISPYILEAATSSDLTNPEFKILIGPKGRMQLDDLPLLLGMGLEIFPFVKARLQTRAKSLDALYCTQYLSCGGVNPYIIALTLRRTAVPVTADCVAMTTRKIGTLADSLRTMTEARHFSTVIADGMKDIDFPSYQQREYFATFVHCILHWMSGQWWHVTNQSIVDARLSWTVKGLHTCERPGDTGGHGEQHQGKSNEPPSRNPNRKRRRSDEDVHPLRQPGCLSQWPEREWQPSPARSASAHSNGAHSPPRKINPYVNITNQQSSYPYRSHG